VYPLAQLGLLDGYRAAVHWRWQDDFAERFPKVIATSHLFDWDRDRLTACGGMSVLDLLLAVLARDHGAELAGAVSEELVVERIREGGERQRIPLQNRLGSSHPKLTQAVLLMEANIEEPLTTDEIAQHVCVSRRQLERIFKQYLNRVPSQYYLELRLNKARQMLMQTSKSIIQIGLSCGFSSGPHFSSAYRNFFGATPVKTATSGAAAARSSCRRCRPSAARWRPTPPWPPACWVASARSGFRQASPLPRQTHNPFAGNTRARSPCSRQTTGCRSGPIRRRAAAAFPAGPSTNAGSGCRSDPEPAGAAG
jgi:AraC-like DNA-binding protein